PCARGLGHRVRHRRYASRRNLLHRRGDHRRQLLGPPVGRRPACGDASVSTDIVPIPAAEISRWDYEADVVIAGYGVAGAAAAVEAARAGADVLVLERTGSWGGAAAMAGGFIYLGGG